MRDRTSETPHFRVAGVNLLTAIISYRNTEQFGRTIQEQWREEGIPTPRDLLRQLSNSRLW